MMSANLALKARALLDAVTFDDSGVMVAGTYQGGNGGLISRDTIKAADALRLELDCLRNTEPGPRFDAMVPAQEALAIDFCQEIAGRQGERGNPPDPVRLLEMAQALYRAEMGNRQ